jgi:gamma-butyrobetaine dioxygenase
MPTPEIFLGDTSLDLTWPDGSQGRYAYIWLRDNCPSAFHPETEERLLDLLSLPDTPRPARADLEGAALHVTWAEDGHESRFALDWLRAHRPGQRTADPAAVAPHVWTANLGPAGIPRHVATDLAESDTALRDWLRDTVRHGLSLVTGVPAEPGAGARIARRLHFLRETNFGVTFEVLNKPDPNNIAYTAHALTLHTDLPNQELPPGYQFLHCLANDAEGGGSVFADGYAIARALRERDPKAFEMLSTVPVPFRFHDRTDDIRIWRPVIGLDRDGTVAEVSWSVHLSASFDMDPKIMEAYYRSYRAFMALTRDTGFQVTLKLAAGEMAVFDNRRVLHGREAFDPTTGFRHLQGCYVDRGDLLSRLRTLSRNG